MALIKKLENIGNAIREKTGKTDLLTLDEMVTEIEAIETGGGSAELPEEAYLITGSCIYRFCKGGWDWFLREYGDKVTTENITEASYMFDGSKIEEIPFDLNFKENDTTYRELAYLVRDAALLKRMGKIVNAYPGNMNYIFQGASCLRELPEFVNTNFNRIHTYNYANISRMFHSCYSLRRIPEEFLKELYGIMSYSYTVFYSGFTSCYALDELIGLNPQSAALTSNAFSNTFNKCYRLKDIIFAVQEDGTPYSVNWKNQTIDLTKYVGHTDAPAYQWGKYIFVDSFNSGITADKEVKNPDAYQRLKDDPDWFTEQEAYSRYNHDSAVNTINSLPSTSNTGCTIKFKGAAGSATDGGAINTLTEEEIAVATAKGWTVTLV